MYRIIIAFVLGWAMLIGGTSATAGIAAADPGGTTTTQATEDARSYDVTASVDYKKGVAQVTEKVHYLNQTGQSLETIAFTVVSNAHGAFRLDGTTVNGQQAVASIGSGPSDATLEVVLPGPLENGVSVDVEIAFRLVLPQQKNIRLGKHDHVISLANWLPTVQVFENGDWPRYPYIETGDAFYSEMARYAVDITFTNTGEALTVASSGQEVSRTVDGSNVRYVLVGTNMREFAVMASERYQRSSTMVGATEVIHYYVPKDAKHAEAVLETTAAALAWGNEHLGTYPHPTMTVVEGMDATGGGQEYSALFVLASGDYNADKVYFNYLIAHETMHMWFYWLVGNNQVTEGWSDESLACFLGYQYVKSVMPEDFQTIWAGAVVGYYESGLKKYGYLPLDSSVYDFVDDEHSYRVSYRQGAIFQNEVMTRMGEDAYYAMMKQYVSDEIYGISTTVEYLQRIVAALPGTTEEKQALIRKYFSEETTTAVFGS